ncbi:hypothetical protein V565_095720, partial [Rhizoctonia solani 123E]
MSSDQSPAGSQVSDITYDSLPSLPSSLSSQHRNADATNITWQSLATPNSNRQNNSGEGFFTAPGTASASNSQVYSVPRPSPLPPKDFPRPVEPTEPMLLSSSRKRVSPPTTPVTPRKRAKTARSNSSREAVDSEEFTFARPSVPNRFIPPSPGPSHQPSSQQLVNSPTNSQSSRSSQSSRQAKPIPGSPVWKHLQTLKSTRQASRMSSPSGSAPGTPSPMPVNASPLGRLSPLSSLGSFSNVLPSSNARTTTGAPATPDTNHQFPTAHLYPPAAKEVHLFQLESYIQSTPDLSGSNPTCTVDNLLLERGHALFKQIYAACLMHMLYRPLDHSRTICLAVIRDGERPVWPQQPGRSPPIPTHILGLFYITTMRISILVWGTCRLVGNKSLHIKYTFLDSCAELELPTEMSKLKPFIEVQIEGSIPFPYLVDKFTFIPSHWTEQTTNLSELEHDMLFCQLISTVVHELPFNFMAKAHPVRPLWAYDVVETQIRLLLGQVAEGQISLEKIKSGKDFVPACVYLHGDAFESNDGPGVSDIPRSAEDEIESEGESQAGVDDAEEIPELAEGLMTHLNTLESSRAGLEITDESDWYITGSNGIKYQIAAPTVSSRSSTPASHQQSSPAKETADSTASALEEDTIKYIHARLVEHCAHQHPSQVSYWKQLKESTLGDSGIGLITTHLWLSSLLHLPSEHCFYIDPPLLDQLVACYKNDPLGTTADHVPLLFNRHRLWAQMGSTAHILALAHVPEVCGAELSWLLLDIEVQEGRVNMIELIVPPCGAFNNDAFADLVSFFLGALSRVLPGPKLSSNTSRVQQRTKTLILPQLATEESVFLVLLGYLLGKMLGQAVPAVDVKTMRQSVCYYYNHALRSSKVDLSFPWPGLTDPKGKLLTEENSEEVGRRQFMLASNREASPFEMFPRRRSYTTTLVTPGPSEPFFQELAQSNSSHPEGILVGTTGRSLPDLEKAVFLGRYSSFKKKFPDSLLQVPEALSLEQYVQLVQELGGPESEAARELLLLGKHNGQRITVDWLKDAIYPKPEQMFASYDLDSVSRSSHEAPKLLKAGTYYPRPDRRFGLTTGNELYINLEGKKIGMHTCPNFCIMSLGDNNQFRLLVFLPGCRNRVDRLWRNMARESEMQDWYHTFLTALRILSTQVPLSWQHAVEKTIEALPTTYRMASEQQNKGGGLYSSTGYRVEPFILNSVFRIMRTIIDTTPQLAKYRGYFFHLVGMNLKLATMNIHGQMDDNPLQHALSPFDFTDWFAGNPHDLVADIGWTANIDRNAMPVDLQTTTMLFRTDPFAELAAAAYKKGQIDHYCSSHVVGGWRSTPLASGQSIGWNWTVKQALRIGNKDKFTNQMSGFLNVVKDADSYGVRFEVRVPAWGANQVMKMNARDILDRLTAAETI